MENLSLEDWDSGIFWLSTIIGCLWVFKQLFGLHLLVFSVLFAVWLNVCFYVLEFDRVGFIGLKSIIFK